MASHYSKGKDQKTHLVYKDPTLHRQHQPNISSNQPSLVPLLLPELAHTIKPFLPPPVKDIFIFQILTQASIPEVGLP